MSALQAQEPPPRNAPAQRWRLSSSIIPIDLAAALPVLASEGEPSAPPSNIRIEFQHHAMKVTVHWPVNAACAQMLRVLLR